MLSTVHKAPCIHVAVAVIVRDGFVLISKRAKKAHQGGLWEFPGGKVESGETVQEALCREIKEELDINVRQSRPLIKLAHHYSDINVTLETLMVTEFDGEEYQLYNTKQVGSEGQEVKWVALAELSAYSFPEANDAILSALNLPDSYLITPDFDSSFGSTEEYIQQFSKSVQANGLVQLRIKQALNDKEMDSLIPQLCDVAREKNAQVLLNSSLLESFEKMGVELGDVGIHLTSIHLHDGSKETLIYHYRKQYPDKMIAASCHEKIDIERANFLKLDFIVVSAVKSTAS
ncbi:MAG: 8-oxo-dGTP diphosphatase MutT, partial [Gammaproteobacteria bacterium]|nr:8-oxo-dGTP diphosphatase MutT [Gammaproteobacteria bacterium]